LPQVWLLLASILAKALSLLFPPPELITEHEGVAWGVAPVAIGLVSGIDILVNPTRRQAPKKVQRRRRAGATPRPGAPAFPCLIQSKVLPSSPPSPARMLSTRAHVQRRDSMALNRKICENLAHHSCGVGNAIRRRVRHQHRGGISGADPRTCELRMRLALVDCRLSLAGRLLMRWQTDGGQ
jgi:hypothetical protein